MRGEGLEELRRVTFLMVEKLERGMGGKLGSVPRSLCVCVCVCVSLIPESAHGTNAASAQMAELQVK